MKAFLTIIAFAFTIVAQAEKMDSTLFVAFYHYTIATQDDEGQNVCDSLRLALLVGSRATYCTNVLSYNRDGRISQEKINLFMMHQPDILTDLEKGEVVSVESIFPYRYETHEPLTKTDWRLEDDTLTIGGLPCHRATCKLYGKSWAVWYSEDIPSSAGPWKLRGLPGLIIKAEDETGIHCFTLYETKNEIRVINTIGNPENQKLSRKKLMAYKKKTLGNPRYAKEPTYYVPKDADDVGEININGTFYSVGMNSHMLILKKSHVYQPLEIE